MSDQTHRLLIEAYTVFGQCAADDDTTVEMLRLQLRGHPGAAAYDREGPTMPRKVKTDAAGNVLDESLAAPDYGDPTGENASYPDKANEALKRRAKLVSLLWQTVMQLDDIRRAHKPADPKLARKLAFDDPSGWCRAHLEHGVHAERWRGDQCRSCYERRLDPPTHAELAHHAAHGKWPGVRVKPKRGQR